MEFCPKLKIPKTILDVVRNVSITTDISHSDSSAGYLTVTIHLGHYYYLHQLLKH